MQDLFHKRNSYKEGYVVDVGDVDDDDLVVLAALVLLLVFVREREAA